MYDTFLNLQVNGPILHATSDLPNFFQPEVFDSYNTGIVYVVAKIKYSTSSI